MATGSNNDPAVTDPTLSASDTALLKGILSRVTTLYAKGTALGDTPLIASPAGHLIVGMGSVNNGDGVTGSLIQGASGSGSVLRVGMNAWNGASNDLFRSNWEQTALTSAARTAAVESADLVNFNARGVIVVIDATVKGGSAPSLTFTIQGKDTLSGKYYTLLQSAAIVGVSTTVLVVYPGVAAVANLAISLPLPRLWRVDVAVANADSMTYSVGANYIL